MSAFTLEEVETIINEYTGGEGARAIAISNSELLALVNDYEIVDVAVLDRSVICRRLAPYTP